MDDDIKKVFYVLVAIVVIGIMGMYIINPIVGKIKSAKPSIENIDYTGNIDAGVNP